MAKDSAFPMQGAGVPSLVGETDSIHSTTEGFPGSTSGREPACQCRRHRDTDSVPGSGRFPRGEHGNPLLYSFRSKESHGQGSLAGYSPWDCKELHTTEVT